MADSVILTAVVISSMAAVLSMSATLLVYYFCCRNRCTNEKSVQELEPLQVKQVLPTQVTFKEKIQKDVNRDDVKKLNRHNVEDRMLVKQNSIKIVSPNLRTKPVPIQVPETINEGNDPKYMLQFSPPFFKRQDSVVENQFSNQAGSIHFTVDYDFNQSTLIVKIIEATGLPVKDIGGSSDPYVRVYLLPDKKIKLETKVRRKTLNPRWSETFYFENYPRAKLQTRVLHLRVLDYDRFSRDDPIGETNVVLAQVDLTQRLELWKPLQQMSKLGELLLSLSYNPTKSILTAGVVKARNLKAKDITGSSDPYVKIWLHIGDKKLEKKKTKVIKSCLAPVYNEYFDFVVPWEKIRCTSLFISVMDYDTVGRNDTIGKIILATKSGPTEAKHWNDMVTKCKTDICQWHQLMTS